MAGRRAWTVAATMTLAATACTWALSGDRAVSDADVQRLRAFDERPTYWLGRSFRGLRLSSVTVGGPVVILTPGPRDPKPVRSDRYQSIVVVYGDCTPAGDDGGCSPPLQIQVWPLCARSLWLVARFGGAVDSYPAARRELRRLADNVRTLRGVPSFRFAGGTELYTGDTTIVVFGRPELHAPAIAALQSANRLSDVGPGEPLPAPVPAALTGIPRCRR